MVGRTSGPLSGLLSPENRTRSDQQMARLARISQHKRLHLVGHVHVVVGKREPGQRARHSRAAGKRALHPGQRQQFAVRVADRVPVQLETVPATRFRPGQDTERVAHAGDRQGRADMLE